MKNIAAALAFIFASLFTSSARADQPLYADLSSHLIAITTGFTGGSVVLFGATDGPGDVVIVVRGPEHDVVVRRKAQIGGVWLNTKQVRFTNVPSFYAAYASSPPANIAPPLLLSGHQIGLDRVKFQPVTETDPDTIATFRDALLEEQRASGTFVETIGKINFLGDRLFRAQLDFPATVPTGTYFIEVLLIRNQAVVGGQTTPLVVQQIGVNAEVAEVAERHAVTYGVIAVFIAAMAGYLASLPFRSA